ncbi:hypothetical protein M8J75_000677 [Diaphorina citri]|nr:hypothetical protein M8J75_000677 [Diaphorina citri]
MSDDTSCKSKESTVAISVDYFKGCLLGALLGDCIGGVFEGREDVSIGHFQMFFLNLTDEDFREEFDMDILNYSDDTAMQKCVAESLIQNKGFNAMDMAKKFVTEYYTDKNRGYGGNVIDVFAKLKETNKLIDPFQPAREQFNGTGSYGNGGAMRIAPVALFCHGNYDVMLDVAAQATKLTHTHRLAVHGALLQVIAVHQSLLYDRSKPIDPKLFLSELKEKMKHVEQNNDDDVEDTYVDKLDVIEKLLEDKNTKSRDVLKCLGNGIAAYESVPTALYTDNPVTRAIQYAITLGGDTDTIATMAGAIAGAYHGRASIEDGLLSVVESVEYIENLAERLYNNVEASG